MPVQIDEVIITTTVHPATAAEVGEGAELGTTARPAQWQEEELAEKILQIIREKSER